MGLHLNTSQMTLALGTLRTRVPCSTTVERVKREAGDSWITRHSGAAPAAVSLTDPPYATEPLLSGRRRGSGRRQARRPARSIWKVCAPGCGLADWNPIASVAGSGPSATPHRPSHKYRSDIPRRAFITHSRGVVMHSENGTPLHRHAIGVGSRRFARRRDCLRLRLQPPHRGPQCRTRHAPRQRLPLPLNTEPPSRVVIGSTLSRQGMNPMESQAIRTEHHFSARVRASVYRTIVSRRDMRGQHRVPQHRGPSALSEA